MLRVAIALLGWFLLGSYLLYEHQEYGSRLFAHLLSSEYPVQTIFHVVMFLMPFVTTYTGYLLYQKEELLKKAIEEKTKEDAILGAIGEGISIQDTSFKVLYQNQLHKEMVGSHVGEYCYKAYQNKDRVCEGCHMANTFKDGRIHWKEQVRTTERGTAHYEIMASPLVDRSGNIMAGIETVRDITERRRTEAEKDLLAKAVSIVTEGIAMTDEKDRYIYLNDAHAKLYGYTPSELVGKTWRDVTPREVIPLIERELPRTLHSRDNGVWSGECPGIRKDGTAVATEVTATARWDEKGEYLGHICVVKNVTERKRVEEALRRSEEEYRMVVNSINEIIYRISFKDDPLRGRVAFLSGPTEKIVGFHRDEFMENPELWVNIIHPDDFQALSEITKKMLDTRQPVVREFRVRHKDEPGYIWFEDKVFPQFDENGDVIGYFGVARDVSERKKAEDERARLEAQLLQAQKMEAVGQLAGGIAHDFNNMLTAIIGYASLLEAKLGAESPLKPYVDQILSSSEKSANITSQLLAFSRKQIMSPKETDLNELIKGMEMFLKSLIGEDVEFRTCFTDMPLMAMVDRGQIEQVLLNLCANARDAMPRGGLLALSTDLLELDEKRIRTYDLDQPGRYALIAVTDTGHGMEEKTRVRIFEPFYTTKGVGKGTGLGLSIVYGIIRQHNGNITVYSEPGKGTTFKIFLPLIVSLRETAKKEKPVTPEGGTECILVAEDDEAVRTLTSHVLQGAGYTVIQAMDGDDAIKKFMENRDHIKLVVLDVVMPKKSGKEVSDAVRKIKPTMRVLLTSGYTADIISTKGITEEGLEFLPKPITPNTLLKKVRKVLDA